MSSPVTTKLDIPLSELGAGDGGGIVVERVVTYSSPDTVVENFETTGVGVVGKIAFKSNI